jgi:hypothetical protein
VGMGSIARGVESIANHRCCYWRGSPTSTATETHPSCGPPKHHIYLYAAPSSPWFREYLHDHPSPCTRQKHL